MPDQIQSNNIPSGARIILAVRMLAFPVCSEVWMMFGFIGAPLQQPSGPNTTKFRLLTATPVLSVSPRRFPRGLRSMAMGVYRVARVF
ncbi:hypothetical protein AGI3411_04210 [Achromobacter agilis]|uniref:Uncharacterized protein n=1 Tax=Achromobacter agilis TaxID=1353888 RepID=A0A446CNQ9_9BURK|nr:hypothetical protein AGI3411_04210 [Achromobacter agilis]